MPSMVWILGVYLTAQKQIIGGCMSGKCLEIPVEMRLIVVMRLMGEISPINRPSRINRVENVLEAIDTRQFFGCRTDHVFELCNEVLLTHA
jgi:hypothetical protein